MSTQQQQFWKNFQKKDFIQAQQQFDRLSGDDKQAILAELFQKSEFHRQPFMVSVLRGTVHEDKSFEDFYQAWLPAEMCHTLKIHGQVFQQGFPAPVRVINATNINNPSDIVSVGITWVANKEEEKGFWEYLEKMTKGEDEINELRHDRVAQVADRELLGLFQVKTDDNLGTPF